MSATKSNQTRELSDSFLYNYEANTKSETTSWLGRKVTALGTSACDFFATLFIWLSSGCCFGDSAIPDTDSESAGQVPHTNPSDTFTTQAQSSSTREATSERPGETPKTKKVSGESSG